MSNKEKSFIMLKIRLFRTGKKNQPSYRIVVMEARSKRDGKYLEPLGFYQPKITPSIFKIDKKRYDFWIERGAQPTDVIRRLVRKHSSK